MRPIHDHGEKYVGIHAGSILEVTDVAGNAYDSSMTTYFRGNFSDSAVVNSYSILTFSFDSGSTVKIGNVDVRGQAGLDGIQCRVVDTRTGTTLAQGNLPTTFGVKAMTFSPINAQYVEIEVTSLAGNIQADLYDIRAGSQPKLVGIL